MSPVVDTIISITTSPMPATFRSSASTQIHFRGSTPDFMLSATALVSAPSAVRTMTMEKAREPIIGS